MIDRESLHNLAVMVCGEEDFDFLQELIALFRVQTPLQLQKIEHGIEHDDFDAVSKAAHALKSSCASLGANDMANDCQELELMRGQDREIARQRSTQLLQRLQQSFARSSSELEDALGDLAAARVHH